MKISLNMIYKNHSFTFRTSKGQWKKKSSEDLLRIKVHLIMAYIVIAGRYNHQMGVPTLSHHAWSITRVSKLPYTGAFSGLSRAFHISYCYVFSLRSRVVNIFFSRLTLQFVRHVAYGMCITEWNGRTYRQTSLTTLVWK